MLLTYDAREDGRSNVQEIQNPDWSSVEQAVRRLDAKRHTEVTLGNHSYISVSGGNGQYYVFIFTDDEQNLVLRNGSSSHGEVLLVSGGQTARLPARHIVQLHEALQAVRAYFEKSTPDPTMDWTES